MIKILLMNHRSIIPLVTFLLLLTNCKDDIIPPPPPGPTLYTKELKGKVILENQTEHSNALVYLDSLNRGVGTDSSGNYCLQFSDEDTIYSGTFHIIYFVNEFDMDTAKYVLVNGKVKLDSLDVDSEGNLPTKELKQLLLIEGWTDKQKYQKGDTIVFSARFTNVCGRTIHIFIPNCWGTFGYVSLYNENYLPYSLTGCDPATADCDIDIYPQGYYEGTILSTIPDGYYCDNPTPLQPEEFLVIVADVFIEGRLLNFWANKFDKYVLKEWYKFHKGKSPKLDHFPNKYKFPIITIIE